MTAFVDWTATHRFVFLALHMSATDFEVQEEEEKAALTKAARNIGVSAGIPGDAAQQMIYDAFDWFYATKDKDAAACVHRLAEAFRVGSPVLKALHTYLVSVAEAHGGLDGAEDAWLKAVSGPGASPERRFIAKEARGVLSRAPRRNPLLCIEGG